VPREYPLVAGKTPCWIGKVLKKLSLLNGQLSLVIGGGAPRDLFLKDAAPKAHPNN
jgi:hypothetical protein